jgi:hypothetical protein
LEAVVDGVAAAAALTQYLAVFEPGGDVLDVGWDPRVGWPVLVADGAAGGRAAGCW